MSSKCRVTIGSSARIGLSTLWWIGGQRTAAFGCFATSSSPLNATPLAAHENAPGAVRTSAQARARSTMATNASRARDIVDLAASSAPALAHHSASLSFASPHCVA